MAKTHTWQTKKTHLCNLKGWRLGGLYFVYVYVDKSPPPFIVVYKTDSNAPVRKPLLHFALHVLSLPVAT